LPDRQLWAVVVTLFAALLVLAFVLKLPEQMRAQYLGNRPSWVAYLAFGIVFSPYCALFFFWLAGNKTVDWGLVYCSELSLCFAVSIWFLTKFAVHWIPYEGKRFAFGSIDGSGDNLNFNPSAKSCAQMLSGQKRCVSVYGLDGGLGFGKSSFTRMIVENLDDQKILYTYISLTETNEAKDFSRLFSERWTETLKGRYPKIDAVAATTMLQSILRESGNGLLSGFLGLVARCNRGLLTTTAKYADRDAIGGGGLKATENTARIFGNVPDFNENLWVVVVDEVERATFDEVYRLIEIVERFRSECRSGAPLRIAFILCVARDELKKILTKFESQNHKALLINEFFFGQPKNIDKWLSLPPIDLQIKHDYLVRMLSPLSGVSSAQQGLIKDSRPSQTADPTASFLNAKEAMGWAKSVLLALSPRMIQRIADDTSSVLATYASAGISVPRVSDILIMEYLRFEFPAAIDFLINQFSSPESKRVLRPNQISRSRVPQQITRVTGHQFSGEDEMVKTERLLGIVCYRLFARSQPDHNDLKNERDSLSNPRRMREYLALTNEPESFQEHRMRLYEEAVNSKSISDLSCEDLLGLADHIVQYHGADDGVREKVMDDLAARLGDAQVESSTINDLVTSFAGVCLVYAEKNKAVDLSKLDQIWGLIEENLKNSEVAASTKLAIIEAFAENGSNNDGFSARFKQLFTDLKRNHIESMRSAIKSVFDAARRDYLEPDGKCIYENENDGIRLLYQVWSGDIVDEKETRTIREAAKKQLSSHPEVIDRYWKEYDYDSAWRGKEPRSVVKESHPKYGNQFLMPLENLLDATNSTRAAGGNILATPVNKIDFWEKAFHDVALRAGLQPAWKTDTLKGILLREGLLDPEIPGEIKVTEFTDAETADGLVVGGSSNIVLAKYKLSASNEELKLVKARFDTGNTGNVVQSVSLYDGKTLVGGPVSVDGRGLADFVNIDLTIPKDGSKTLTVRGNLNNGVLADGKGTCGLRVTFVEDQSSFAISGVNPPNNPRKPTLKFEKPAVTRALTFAKSKPTVSPSTLPSSTLQASTAAVMRFTVSADAAGDVALKRLTAEVSVSGAAILSTAPGSSVRRVGDGSNLGGEASLVDGLLSVTFTKEEIIPAGTSRTYDIRLDVSGAIAAGDSISTHLFGDSQNLNAPICGSLTGKLPNLGVGGVPSNFIWSDLSAKEHNDIIGGSADWTNGYFVKGLPTDVQTLSK